MARRTLCKIRRLLVKILPTVLRYRIRVQLVMHLLAMPHERVRKAFGLAQHLFANVSVLCEEKQLSVSALIMLFIYFEWFEGCFSSALNAAFQRICTWPSNIFLIIIFHRYRLWPITNIWAWSNYSRRTSNIVFCTGTIYVPWELHTDRQRESNMRCQWLDWYTTTVFGWLVSRSN